MILSERELEHELRGTELQERIDSLRANPEVVTRIEIRRQTVTRVDTLQVTDTLRIVEQQGDTVTIDLEPFTDQGITVLERIRTAPRPDFFSRRLEVSFDPDTLALALVRDEMGIARIISSIEREGIDTRTLFAGELSSEPGLLSKAYDIVQPFACLASGFAAAHESWAIAGGAGATCLAKPVIRF